MDNDIKVAMLNRGRVVWINQSEVAEQLKKGWLRIDNPKQDFYPEYDTATPNTLPDDDRLHVTRVVRDDQDYVDRLGLIQI